MLEPTQSAAPALPTIQPHAIRDELEKLVLADLHRPVGGPNKELDEASVSERYLVGMLAPRRNPPNTDLFDELAVRVKGTEEDGKIDIVPPQAESLMPSSFLSDLRSFDGCQGVEDHLPMGPVPMTAAISHRPREERQL